MSSEEWQRVEAIFDEARSLPAGARAAFVAEACGPDARLRRDVLDLLDAEAAAGEFLSRPAIERLAEEVAAEGWRLRPGERVGAYTIVRLLGVGGAGEVWRARDERLARDVAIKVLLPHVSADPERLRRFADEAKTAGSLNHSNILTVYDIGEHRGIPYLVAECLEGQSLRQVIEKGSVRPDEVTTIGLALARGLAAAHARGIIHRDLKPENTFIRSDGVVKILDFGLAKLQSALEELHGTRTQTVTGVILGTAGYMAPEQVRGEAADARSDLFSVGVMLYEMLAGRNPFRGASTFETLHAVLSVDPPDLVDAGMAPAPLAGIVTRLLAKAPDARFQSALDLAWALEHATGGFAARTVGPIASGSSSRATGRRGLWLMAAIAAAGLLGTAALVLLASQTSTVAADPPLAQFTLPLPPGTSLASAPAVSPDSRHIAFAAGSDARNVRLFVRTLASRDAVAIPGTSGARHPFWAPDSRGLGFFAADRGALRLMTVSWPGGAPVPVAAAPFPLGGSWSTTGTIVFGGDVILAGLSRVPAAGGGAEPITTLDLSRGDNAHGWPVFLPDGRHFLYYVRSIADDRRGIYVARADGPAVEAGTPLFASDSDAVYVHGRGTSEGALLSVGNGRIEVRRFDPARRTLIGDVQALDLAAAESALTHPVMLSASADVLAFADRLLPYGHRLEAVDRSGKRQRLWDAAEPQNWPRVSPDGRRLARQRVDPLRNNPDIWVEDLDRGTIVRVTTAVEPDIQPVWSHDGTRLAYTSGNLPGRAGKSMISIAGADGSGVVRSFPCPKDYCEATDWSADGSRLLVNVQDRTGSDVWTISAHDGSSSRPLLTGTFAEKDARFSPDARWIAYVSNESGRNEVSVRSIEGPPVRIAISPDGGTQPVWRRDGSELLFVDREGRLRSVAVSWTGGTPRVAAPVLLAVPSIGSGHWGTQYDLSPNGQRIFLLRANDDPPPRDIHVIVGWRSLLKR